MKKITSIALVTASLAILNSCDNPQTEAGTPATESEITLSPNDSLVVINEGVYQFAITLPKDLMINHAPQIEHMSSTGELHIKIGNDFWLVASESQQNLDAIKTELGEDQLFSFKVVEEDKSTMVFQRFLPDGTEYDYSMRGMSQVGNKHFVFKACDEGEFTKEAVTKMKHSVSSVHQAV
ncbi:MAG: hypothetical protein RLZZ262_2014 [Bacteroidota bacterium]|jgi:hypothetical protein